MQYSAVIPVDEPLKGGSSTGMMSYVCAYGSLP